MNPCEGEKGKEGAANRKSLKKGVPSFQKAELKRVKAPEGEVTTCSSQSRINYRFVSVYEAYP